MTLFGKLKDLRTMLIDDDDFIRDSMELFFRQEGCQLLTFETAEEGLKVLKKERSHIIVCDYMLPGMNGLEFFRHIEKSHADTMKVLMTAYANLDVVTEALRIGIDDFIQKPFTARIVEESLCRLIEKRENNRHEPFINGQKLTEIGGIKSTPLRSATGKLE